MQRKLSLNDVASKIWMGKTKGQTTQFPQQIHCKGKKRERGNLYKKRFKDV